MTYDLIEALRHDLESERDEARARAEGMRKPRRLPGLDYHLGLASGLDIALDAIERIRTAAEDAAARSRIWGEVADTEGGRR